MTKVFISHSTPDRGKVERYIIDLLRSKGIETWYAKENIQTAEEWERSIVQGLKDCDWFLVALTPNAANSKWVRREVHWALERRPGKVIPVLLEHCDPVDLNLGLHGIQYVDLTDSINTGQARLLSVWGIDFETPLGPGLGASAKIVGGYIRYEQNSWRRPELQMTVPVVDGVIERDKGGKLNAYVKVLHPFNASQQMLERLGLDSFNLKSEALVGSVDPENPTVFTDQRQMRISAGEKMTEFLTGREVVLPVDLVILTETKVAGYLMGQSFIGTFSVEAKYNLPYPALEMSGTFDVNLS